MTTAATPRSWLAAILRAEDVPWPRDQTDAVLAACREEGLAPLVHALGRRLPGYSCWPSEARDGLERDAHTAAATELLAREELPRALSALAAAGIAPILLKGAPLAYTVYESPSHRERLDTDLLLPANQAEPARATLAARGYGAPLYSAGAELLGQFPLVRRDHMGVEHWLDVHWEISTARAFAAALTYEELAASAVPVPALGQHARTPSTVHTLLLACMHPVMHHRNAVRLAWLYDVHLLAARMDAAAWQSFAELAKEKRLRAVSAQGLSRAHEWMGTPIPPFVTTALATNDGAQEPSAQYLAPGRGWLDELGSDLLARASWRRRFRLLREIALPSPSYMLGSYRLAGPAGWAALPVLYVHRGLRGVWRVARGAK